MPFTILLPSFTCIYTLYIVSYTNPSSLKLFCLFLLMTSCTCLVLDTLNIGYTMKQRGIQDLDHLGNWIRRPRTTRLGRLNNWFLWWSKSCIPWLFHRIRYLYYTSLSVCLSVAAKYCSRVLEAYRSRQDCRHWHPAHILGQHVVWMITLVIALSLCYFPVIEPLWALIRLAVSQAPVL